MHTRHPWYFIYFVHWVIIGVFWFNGSGALLMQGFDTVLIALGRLAGLSAAYMILVQFFCLGRFPWLERSFGLDTLTRIHHRNGTWALLVLLTHPFLLAAGYSRIAQKGFFEQFGIFLAEYPYVVFAFAGFVLFFVLVATSLHIVRNRLRYEWWYLIHLIAYVAVFLSFWHQLANGTDLLASRVFYWYWIALYTLVFGIHIVFRFVRPLYNFYRHRFYVTRVVRETHDTVSVYFDGRNLEQFRIEPGQFMIFRFLAKGYWWEAHPFSLSFVPKDGELRITVKNSGDFTARVPDIPPGTPVLIDGPYGVFTLSSGASEKFLFIAGGIGITPIRSLLEEMIGRGNDAVLLYANKTRGDIVFKHELQELASSGTVRIEHVLSNEPLYEGETGLIDEEKLKRLVPDIVSREVYLCGPVPMMDSILNMLNRIGISKARIHFEKFSL